MPTDENRTLLADKVIWIIDDDIPIRLGKFEKDDMLTGKRPIDHGALLALLSYEEWVVNPVKALCEELVREAKSVTAFTHPSSAIRYLSNGAPIPDVVIYDLVYGSSSSGTNSLAELERLLSQCVSVVQVYTQEGLDRANRDLEPLLVKFPSRLEKPASKSSTTAEELERIIVKRLENSLSARLATDIRRLSSVAVEDVLVKIDNLPLNVAVQLLGGKETEIPEELSELDLIEFLSIKVGETLELKQELAEAIRQYAIDKGISPEQVGKVAQEIVALLVTHVREHIRTNGGLFDMLRSAWTKPKQTSNSDDKNTEEIIQEFFAFRLYAQPTDDIVRTGDIIALNTEQSSLDLYLVITPLCDLARFWKKTRGTLTYVRMRPLTKELGFKRARMHGNNKFEIENSIVAVENTMVIPSVSGSEGGRLDYLLFAHEIESKEFEKPDGANNSKRLTYTMLEGKVVRRCHISEPFLGGMLMELRNSLFRPGIPDFPDEEKKRLTTLFQEFKGAKQ